jgi:hypothetical protein
MKWSELKNAVDQIIRDCNLDDPDVNLFDYEYGSYEDITEIEIIGPNFVNYIKDIMIIIK